MATLIKVLVPSDDNLMQQVTDAHVAEALAARQRGESVILGGGRDSWDANQTNAVLDYMLANKLPATRDSLGAAQIPSGQFAAGNFGISGVIKDAIPYAKMLAATAGAAYLGGGMSGFGSAGSAGGAGIPSLGGLSTAAGGAMTDAEIAAALEAGQYGGMTGALTSAEIAAAGGASTGPGSLTSGLSNLVPSGANTLGSLISGGAALYGANQAAGSAADAASIQKQASDAALAEQRRQFDLGQAAQMPWRTAGETALSEQVNLMGLGAHGAEGQLASLMKSPGYEFRLGEGQKALERSAAARGGLFGGATGKALTQYGQDYATGEYGNRLAQLSSLSGQGQSAASGMAGQGTQYAGNVSNLLTGMGNAGAASSIAQGTAKQSGILGAGQALSNLFNPPKQQLSLADLLRGG